MLNLDVDSYQNIAVHEATAGTGANQYLIILQEDQNQNDIPMPVNLDASDSYGPDALSETVLLVTFGRYTLIAHTVKIAAKRSSHKMLKVILPLMVISNTPSLT